MRRAGPSGGATAQAITSPGERVSGGWAGKGHNGEDAKFAAKVFSPDAT